MVSVLPQVTALSGRSGSPPARSGYPAGAKWRPSSSKWWPCHHRFRICHHQGCLSGGRSTAIGGLATTVSVSATTVSVMLECFPEIMVSAYHQNFFFVPECQKVTTIFGKAWYKRSTRPNKKETTKNRRPRAPAGQTRIWFNNSPALPGSMPVGACRPGRSEEPSWLLPDVRSCCTAIRLLLPSRTLNRS